MFDSVTQDVDDGSESGSEAGAASLPGGNESGSEPAVARKRTVRAENRKTAQQRRRAAHARADDLKRSAAKEERRKLAETDRCVRVCLSVCSSNWRPCACPPPLPLLHTRIRSLTDAVAW